MATLPQPPAPSSPAVASADGLRLQLAERASPGAPDGAWWPRSRELRTEVRTLVDEFPTEVGRINRLLYSRPDWDDPLVDGRGVRKVRCERGYVKLGSFPSDDTHLMVLSMADGRRLRLQVIPGATSGPDGARLLAAAGAGA